MHHSMWNAHVWRMYTLQDSVVLSASIQCKKLGHDSKTDIIAQERNGGRRERKKSLVNE